MVWEYKLTIFKDIKEILFRYCEVDFPITDTAKAKPEPWNTRVTDSSISDNDT